MAKPIVKHCDICGISFEVMPWRKVAKYCSRECYYKSLIKARVEVACGFCDKKMLGR